MGSEMASLTKEGASVKMTKWKEIDNLCQEDLIILMYFISGPECTLIVFLWVSAAWEREVRPRWNAESPEKKQKTDVTHNARQSALRHDTKDIFAVLSFLRASLSSPENGGLI